jgi:hypothetical protein
MLEIIGFLGEDFGFENPEEYKQDGFAFRCTHPQWQFASVTDSLKLDGSCLFSMYGGGGDVEGRYGGQSGVGLFGSQGYLISMYLNETSLGRNGRMEKLCLQFPHWNAAKPFDMFQSSWLKVTVISEFTKLTLPQAIQYRLYKPESFSRDEQMLLREFAAVQRKYD